MARDIYRGYELDPVPNGEGKYEVVKDGRLLHESTSYDLCMDWVDEQHRKARTR